MNMDIWVIGTLNQIFIRNSCSQRKFSEDTVVSGKAPFFVIGPSCTTLQFVLKLTFDRTILYGNVTLSIVILSTTIWSASFLKKVFIFQKTCFKVKKLKMFKIFSDGHIKTCQSLKRRSILEITSTVFRRTLRSFCWLWNKTSTKKHFSLLRKKTNSYLAVKFVERKIISSRACSVYLRNHLV